MTEDGFRAAWASQGGTHAALQHAYSLIMRRAGEAFARGQDAEATALRRLALQDLKPMVDAASEKLNEYIKMSKDSKSYS